MLKTSSGISAGLRVAFRVFSATLIVATNAACPGRSAPPPDLRPVTETAALPEWLPGVWTREWIRKRGVSPDLFDVHYLQTTSVFADVRFARDRGSFPCVRSFADLTDAQLLVLAKQRAFMGVTTVSGVLATWHHEIDFQPPDLDPDVGRLEPSANAHMLEHALDGSYVESWRSLTPVDGRYLVVRAERSGRLDRALIVVGDYFVYVRNRRKDLPVAESLDSLIVHTRATRAQIVGYLDCEFSTGLVRGGSIPWQIQQSTLPWLEHQHLPFADEFARTRKATAVASRAASTDRWSVPVNTFADSELSELFPPRR